MEDIYSTNKKSIASRNKYLLDDDFAERESVRKKQYYNKKQLQKTLKKRNDSYKDNFRASLVKRIQFHLNKGRDVANIAVRENLLVSHVQEVVNQINAEQANKNC